MRPPSTHDRDYLTAMRMAEECERRAEHFPDKSFLHAARDKWLERACELELPMHLTPKGQPHADR